MRTLFVTMCSCLLLMMSFPTGAWAKKGFKAQHVILIGLDAWGSYSILKQPQVWTGRAMTQLFK